MNAMIAPIANRAAGLKLDDAVPVAVRRPVRAKKRSVVSGLVLLALLGTGLLSPSPSSAGETVAVPTATEASLRPPSDAASLLRDKWGIEIASVRLSGQGYFVDFRYKVMDPEKAAPLAKSEIKPYLIEQASGKRLGVPTTPKLGSLRQTAIQLLPGRIYFIFFGNSSGVVKSGSKVTVVIGGCRIEKLTVE